MKTCPPAFTYTALRRKQTNQSEHSAGGRLLLVSTVEVSIYLCISHRIVFDPFTTGFLRLLKLSGKLVQNEENSVIASTVRAKTIWEIITWDEKGKCFDCLPSSGWASAEICKKITKNILVNPVILFSYDFKAHRHNKVFSSYLYNFFFQKSGLLNRFLIL
jgi:hypothetical protein